MFVRSFRWTVVGLVGSLAFASVYTHSSFTQSCCALPTNEVVTSVGQDSTSGSIGDFYQSVSDSPGDSFSRRLPAEYNGSQGSDSCYWPIGGPPEYPTVSDSGGGPGSWTVGSTNVWGADLVGWTPTGVITIRDNGPAHGVTFPCGFNVYQDMEIQICDGLYEPYEYDNTLTAFIYVNPNKLIDSRYSVGGGKEITINY